jgi:hypothetical protein
MNRALFFKVLSTTSKIVAQYIQSKAKIANTIRTELPTLCALVE